jgi:hypothetical protein
MLSVLIPTYNYDITPLVHEIHQQALSCNMVFEILVYDDGSKSPLNKNNQSINELEYCKFKELEHNIGRSAIRNLLGTDAKYEFLLFLDADVLPISSDFLLSYKKMLNLNTQIIYGGICYQKEVPAPKEKLRWIYGKKREALTVEERSKSPYLSFLTLNFIVRKGLFSHLKFNEDIPNLRNEDLIFAIDARAKQVTIKHINNPVLHLGIESSQKYLKKTIDTLHSFNIIISKGFLNPNDASLTRIAFKMESLKLGFVFRFIHRLFNTYFEKNLLSNKPSLFIFDVYRLCYFLHLKKN